MQYFSYWARAEKQGPEFPVTCWGYSNESEEAARRMALERAEAAVAKLLAPKTGNEPADYYDADPLKERVIEEITHDGQVLAVVTRNAYGALVINTANVAFLDVDFTTKRRGAIVSIWKKLTGDDTDEPAEAERLAAVQEVLAAWPELGGRIYRTANGFRIMITSATLIPTDAGVSELMQVLGVDELYRKLCLRQNCFRARLTPKPWRIGMRRPPVRYPLIGAYSRTYEAWLSKYETKSRDFRVSRLVATFGPPAVCAEAEKVLRLHDSDLAGEDHKLA